MSTRRLSGFQRLFILLAAIWLLSVVVVVGLALYSRYDMADADVTTELAVCHGAIVTEPGAPGLPYQPWPSPLEKFAACHPVVSWVGFGAALWLVPIVGVLTLISGVRWVRRGFQSS